ncbi:putative zn(2)-C6 fungal-type DNA-binding domain-containing protein [Septoria linicola]|nr:putative zn(2)-C6 fungal-type DNA-binding domain-containing protein [Septoria linicola]
MASNNSPAIDPSLQSISTTNAPSNIAPAPLRYEVPPPQFAQQQQQQQNPSSNVGNYPSASPSNPYYGGYPTPQTQTPLQPTPAGHSLASAGASNQASPQDATTQYQQIAQDSIDNSHVSDGNDAPAGEDPKRPRACEACRGLKVRCDQDPNHPDLPCRRCAKAGRQCVITAPSRKRQKKADSRVAELEKKLDHLTTVLQQQQQGGQLYASQYGQAPTADMQGRAYAQAAQQYQYAQQTEHDASPMQPPNKRKRTDDQAPQASGVGGEAPAPASSSRYDARSQSEQDISNRLQELNRDFHPSADVMRQLTDTTSGDFLNRIHTLVSPPLGVQIFDRYVEKLAPHMPAVIFAPGTEAEQVWKQTPILYVSILSAAGYGILHPDVSSQLSEEAIKAIADCVVVNGAKSIELVQAMQVLALWYKPPENARQTNFYQIIHMAAVMAIDLGLGKRFNPAKLRRGFNGNGPHSEYAPGAAQPTNSDTLEARRAWLGCYYLCASASMVLRRPNLVRWTKYMEESVEILETSSEALPTDKLFCQHIKIQHICEEVSIQFLMDDNTASISITDPKVTYTLKVLENELKEWSRQIPQELKTHPSLTFFEHVASLYLHEIALHFNHNIEDFRLPFTEESLKSVNSTSEKLTQNQISALEACRVSAQGVLEGMLAYDTETVKALPMLLFFVRCTYALVILIKMHVAVTTAGSEIGKVMTAEDINVDRYMNGLVNKLTTPAPDQDYRPHPKIERILTLLRDWFTKHKETAAAQSRGEAPPSQAQQSDQYGQTPLHLLAQTATDAKQEQKQGDNQAWTFNTPFPIDYGSDPSNPQNQLQASQQGGSYQQGNAGYDGNFAADFDPNNPWLWGSNFQQAMDLNLADMSGVTGGGIDGLFFGNGLAPFNYNGDAPQ